MGPRWPPQWLWRVFDGYETYAPVLAPTLRQGRRFDALIGLPAHAPQERPETDGHFILMFLPGPASVLRSLKQLLRPGGILAFQKPTSIPLLGFAARFSLWPKFLSAIHENLPSLRRKSGDGYPFLPHVSGSRPAPVSDACRHTFGERREFYDT